ncbi:hypothetical protein [Parafrankia sp. EUN1f]|uniref:hypothetical protein n=1 Tax=Parafrankia sp. EUN1f TaxID=102897 RepID=UPI0001C45A42|nr:hypothetical protein [Parafrankia sp. EUN1f]EFC83258.1 hypothetical protein FrEUN1fDRAFT_3638 [Parafrankia sp. EUN1f]
MTAPERPRQAQESARPAPAPSQGRTRRTRLIAATGLAVLAPICAEYLIGYADSISRPLTMLAGLIIFVPLYGTVAVLIREITRRVGGGWPTLILLAAAFGLTQAGLVDQSLFNPHLTGDPTWDDDRTPTLLGGTGLSVYYLLNFLTGHIIWSFTAPIVVVESYVPRLADRPWLHRPGILTLTVLYLAAAALIHDDASRTFRASPTQLAATALAVVLLTAAAFAAPRPAPRRTPPVIPTAGRRHRPWLLAGAVMIALTAHQLLPPTWPGVTVDLLILLGGTALLAILARRRGWGRRHALAAAGGALLVNAGLSFVVDPLGDVSYPAKYAANAMLTVMVLVLLAHAHRRSTAPPR